MLVSYGICVCNEYRELKNLLIFLRETRNPVDTEIVCLVDSSKDNKLVRTVLSSFPEVKVIEREFKNDFADHKNYLNSQCEGDVIFNIDADEMPQEMLIKLVENAAKMEDFDVLYVPRINICPGYTEKFIKKHNFNVNNVGWINWPDYQGRVFKKGTLWEGIVHEKPNGQNIKNLPADPTIALWHIKDTDRQNKQNEYYKDLMV